MEDTRKYQAIRKLAGKTKEEDKEEEKTYIDASDDDFGLILNCAVRYAMGRELNLENPVTYTEKLQWLKLYDHRAEYTP